MVRAPSSAPLARSHRVARASTPRHRAPGGVRRRVFRAMETLGFFFARRAQIAGLARRRRTRADVHPARSLLPTAGEPHDGAAHSQARAEHLRRRVRRSPHESGEGARAAHGPAADLLQG
eukprot:31180-Pelagococcus_subviridis.AAC.4